MNTCFMDIGTMISVVVGFFSILVMFLLGWNIYSIVDAKHTITEMNKKINSVAALADNQANQLSATVYGTMAEYYRKKNEDVYEYFNYALLTLLYTKKIGNFGLCNSQIRMMIEAFPVNISISNFQKSQLLSIIGEFKSDEMLIELEKLRHLIILMKSKD